MTEAPNLGVEGALHNTKIHLFFPTVLVRPVKEVGRQGALLECHTDYAAQGRLNLQLTFADLSCAQEKSC